MIRHCTGYTPQNLGVACIQSGFSWGITLEFLTLHVHRWEYSSNDPSNLETVQNQIRNLSIIFPNPNPTYINCHSNYVIRYNLLAVPSRSIVNHTCKSDTFITIRSNILQTVIQQDRRQMPYLGCVNALLWNASLSLSFGSACLINFDTAWECLHLQNTHSSIICLFFYSTIIFHQLQPCCQTIQSDQQLTVKGLG